MKNRLALVFALALLVGILPAATTSAQDFDTDVTYTTDADFDLGTLVSVNHDAPSNDQLQLDSPTEPFPFINVAASGRGTVVRVNTDTGDVVGEYRTAPDGRGLNPSRTTVDLFGNVWTANRDEVDEIGGDPHGSAVKIGLIVGGTRVDETGAPDPSGDYLAPPFGYNTCSDRDADGLIRTSAGLGDILNWPDLTDGLGGVDDGLVEDALDECILIYQRLPNAEQARHVSVDADNNVWVGGYPFEGRMFYKLSGNDGTILDSFDARDFGCGGYGGLVDGNGVLWSIGWGTGEGSLLRYDPTTDTGSCINIYGGYGLGIDTNGYVWGSIWENGIAKVSPDGFLEAGFPKSTWPTPSTVTATGSVSPLMVEAKPALGLMALALQAGDLRSFQVSPMDDWVQSSGTWPAGATISLIINDGSGVVYTDSRTADGDGFFNFHFGGTFDLQRGHMVTVSDGTTTKIHTVIDLYVDSVDLVGDDIIGRADPGSDVEVWVDGDGLSVTPDGSGNWIADFSGLVDITEQSTGGAQQYDADNDSTYVWWSQPQFQVSPMDDWVQSSGTWPAGATISLIINDGSGVVYTDSRTADGDGFFNFHFGGTFDLQRGHMVTVSDGTTTKIHTVIDLYVDSVDLVGDDIIGRADPGSDVEVWVDGDGLSVTPDGSGNWIADFSGLVDITEQSTGGAQQYDADNDSTYVWWSQPQFQVSPMDDWVQSSGTWPAGATISLIINDGSGVVYTDSRTADGDGFFNFHFGGTFDLQRGHMVTVSDGTTTKIHTVIDLYVDSVDLVGDDIIGRADPGSDVEVWVDGDGLSVTPDGSGNWIADFSGLVDITEQSTGGAQQYDADNDSTYIWFAHPSFQVAPQDDWVQSQNPWAPGATISLIINDGSGVVYTDSRTADGDGFFNFNLWDVFDIERGHIVTVSDGFVTKAHTVEDLFVDGVDVTADTVFGRTDPFAEVDVWVHGDGNVTATADGSGNWTADFSGMTDLTYLSDGGSQQFDDDGDSTGVWWASPRFQVAPDDDWVQSYNRWTPGATISLTIEDGSGVVYSDSQTADTNGNFNFGLQGVFDLQRGHLVTVSDGITTKTHTVIDLSVDGVDLTADTVFGRTDPFAEVDVWVHGDGNVTATADGSGNWTADFSGMTDLTYLSDGGSQQFDDDGDSTGVWWASPRFQVAPDDDWVQSYNRWTPGATISLTIEDGSGVVYTDSQTADTNGNFNFGLQGVFDLQRGHVVTVSDGTTTKTHTVIDVMATVHTDADTVIGTANPDAWVQVGASQFQDWSGRLVQADSGGNWTADFSVPADGQPAYDITGATFVDVEEFDDDGDATYRQFGPPVMANRGVAVTPIDNHVWVASSGIDAVTRLDNDGNVLKIIPTGDEPTGVAVDAAGKVWVTNQFSDNTVRIDPNAATDGLGEVDLTVDLGPGASPYNYSDMTGAVVVGSTSPQGFWTVVQDSGEDGFEWGRLTWNTEPEGDEPVGTEIVVEIRTADSEAGLGGATFIPVLNGELFSSFGRFIEVRATLKASPGGLSPVLSDIRVQPAIIEVAVDIKLTSCPNPFNVSKIGVMPVAILGTGDFDVTVVDPATVMLEGVAPLRWAYEDVATPFEPYLGKADAYDCNEYGPDGYMDLTLKFEGQEVAAALGDVTDGDVLVLTLTGELLDGTPTVGEDVIVILKKGKK